MRGQGAPSPTSRVAPAGLADMPQDLGSNVRILAPRRVEAGGLSVLEPGEAALHAYVDSQLPPARRAAMEAYLAQHPVEAARAATYRAQNIKLHALFGSLATSSSPELEKAAERLCRQLSWRGRSGRMFRIAGPLALLLGAGLLVASWGWASSSAWSGLVARSWGWHTASRAARGPVSDDSSRRSGGAAEAMGDPASR